MKVLEKYSYLIIILCLAAMIVTNFTVNDNKIKNTVSVIGFIIVLLTIIPAAIYRKGQKGR
ncbi:hypothetical protein ABEX69_03085 [Bacillus safensis]|uniref:hypothetical protein n=1 Tax=Bacillus safensis TaxID=561879 RepID=UPI00227FC7D3|nr:hypothetical protein [Bacillus safensis]MCY7566652.1 hypothetical protein [Bacillus safensis]MCY7662390.1 hypothetical protein [Bacillus safensis]MEC3748795.1 hypothetical protein [Bacillus safensis]MEC3784763.1 hypothetical protein [Bacillus safensis]